MRNQFFILFGLTLTLSSVSAHASFCDVHPLRCQVNSRVVNQNERINAGTNQGTINATEQQQLQQEAAQIRAEEVADVQANGGHLTQAQQAQLNAEQNALSQQIYEDRH